MNVRVFRLLSNDFHGVHRVVFPIGREGGLENFKD